MVVYCLPLNLFLKFLKALIKQRNLVILPPHYWTSAQTVCRNVIVFWSAQPLISPVLIEFILNVFLVFRSCPSLSWFYIVLWIPHWIHAEWLLMSGFRRTQFSATALTPLEFPPMKDFVKAARCSCQLHGLTYASQQSHQSHVQLAWSQVLFLQRSAWLVKQESGPRGTQPAALFEMLWMKGAGRSRLSLLFSVGPFQHFWKGYCYISWK